MNRSVVIIIHEIYGVNDHIAIFSKRLTSQGFEVICPNLLDFELPFDYEQEEEAYHHFMNNIGFDHSVQRISSLVEGVSRKYERVFLIGFSVGATIAWLCSKDQSIDGIICFYGSRIREYVDIVPL
ncbi:dienelactone hydrolase family protein [Bacillus weihaiensis]|uniref:dienelactone hydrolase family protein n=1 Tax=Bacillus weihaiensis TaxID=1547283 RepID=UPI0030811067